MIYFGFVKGIFLTFLYKWLSITKMNGNIRQLFFVGLAMILLGSLCFALFSGGPALQRLIDNQSHIQSPRDTSQKPSKGSSQIATVKRVVDGDTVELTDGRKVRYLNMDTPESVKPNTPEQCYAKKASHRNEELVSGKTITLVFDKQAYDRYDRLLALIFLNDADKNDTTKSVNAELVREGAARALIIKPNNTYEALFYSLQSEAESAKKGLWGECKRPFIE
jgi:micrococcal nuclease